MARSRTPYSILGAGLARSGERLLLMSKVPIALLVVLAGSAAQAPQDSTITVHGFLQPDDSGRWTLLLPDPVPVAGRPFGVLAAVGDAARWARVRDRFVEVVGRVRLGGSPRPVMAIERLREIEPPGTGRTAVDLSFNQRAVVTLAAIPNRFAWRLKDGQPSGVQPLLMFTVHNEGQTDIDFLLPTNDALCARVRASAGARETTWQTSLPAPSRQGVRVVIRLGAVYQQFVPIPADAAPTPGRYDADVTLCGMPDYHGATTFEVRSP